MGSTIRLILIKRPTNKEKIRQEIINGTAKHTVFPNEEYQRKSTTYLTNRALTVDNNKIPKIIFEKITFYRNHYEMTFNYTFDEISNPNSIQFQIIDMFFLNIWSKHLQKNMA